MGAQQAAPLPTEEILDLAIQIAEALEVAHAKGIVHRDIKPANIFVSERGQVKVLDFGVAKMRSGVGGETAGVSEAGLTSTGALLGTVGYMAAEQVRGQEGDGRADVFALGAGLYEMATGWPAFGGDTPGKILEGILNRTPTPAVRLNPQVPEKLEAIIAEALEKDRKLRYQSAAELKADLQRLKRDTESGRVGVGLVTAQEGHPQGVPLRVRRWGTALLVAVIAAALGFWIVRSRKESSEATLIPVPLTSYPGYEDSPTFSPDGTQVAFQWCTEGPSANCDIYIKQIGMEPPSRLTTDPAEDFSPAWSPDGKFIAFLRKLSAARTAVILIPQRGGPERILAEADIFFESYHGQCGSYLTWTPDSKWLVLPWRGADKPDEGLFLLNLETRETRRLTTSVDDAPAFSPDGRTLAFNGRSNRDFICLLRLTKEYKPEGEPEQVAPAAETYLNFGAAWSPDGRDIVFSSANSEYAGLWRVAAMPSARPRRLAFASEGASAPAVSRQMNRLAYVANRTDTNIWRIDLRRPGQNPGIPARLIVSTRGEESPAYSPDGKRIAFVSDRSGALEIWACASDGSNPVQLTAFGGDPVSGPKWSPDGQNIAFAAVQAGNQDLYVVSANGGPPRRMTTHPRIDGWPYWSRDGESLYFKSNRSGVSEIWKMPAQGGEAVQITRHGGDAPQESPDGRFVYYEKGWPARCSVWRAPVGGGEEVKVLEPTHAEAGWTVGKLGIYFFTPADAQGRSDLCLYKFATAKISKILTIERNVFYRIAVSPDERTILYTQYDQTGSDLMLVENFR
ncbi:MAG: serine/threonine-protein kinase [Acidobacteriia bacterium]|nr:serine/threonine-protein kinase [Terriglobia bacterium]